MKAFKKTKVLYATTYAISNYNLSFSTKYESYFMAIVKDWIATGNLSQPILLTNRHFINGKHQHFYFYSRYKKES